MVDYDLLVLPKDLHPRTLTMRPNSCHFMVFPMLAFLLNAQMTISPVNGGNGADGAFNPAGNITLDTSIQPTYNFTSFNIPAGVTVTATGTLPIVIRVQGAVTIAGILTASGVDGAVSGNNTAGGSGGPPGAGGGGGGNGGAHPSNPFNGSGNPGLGVSPGLPGTDSNALFTDPVGGGGGGGNATAGANGGPPNNTTTTLNTSGAGGAQVAPCRVGSGGGGGAADIDSATTATSNDGGGGGGGGGGWITLISDTSIVVAVGGSILANGGNGGTSAGNGGGGGGGSGGRIDLGAPSINIQGSVRAQGGQGGLATQAGCGCSPGGAGGNGCLVFHSDSATVSGTVIPAMTGLSSAMVTNQQIGIGILSVVSTSPTTPYLVLAALTPSPTPIPTPFGSFVLDLNDFIFNLLYPVNQVPTVIGPVSGIGSGLVTFNVAISGLPPGTEGALIVQGLAGQTVLTGVSNVVRLQISL